MGDLLFKLRTEEFGKDIKELIRVTGKKSGVVLKDEGRLLTKDVIQLTPPFGNAPSTESLNAQRKIGEKAVERDIRRVFKVVDASKIRNPKLRDQLERAIRKRDLRQVAKILKECGIRTRDVLPAVNGSVHDELRDRRGRVQKHKWIWLLKEQGLKGYIRAKKAHVGKAKSGWMKAARGLGVKLPNWIAKHDGAGAFVDRTRDPRKPMIRIVNGVPFIQAAGTELQIVSRAMQNRARNIKAKIAKILASGWKKKG